MEKASVLQALSWEKMESGSDQHAKTGRIAKRELEIVSAIGKGTTITLLAFYKATGNTLSREC